MVIPKNIEWRISKEVVDYEFAVREMEKRVAQINNQEAKELIWLLEHPPLYTAGTSAHKEDLLEPGRFPVYQTGRGGQFTYHGPGQRVVYVLVNLNTRGRDIRAFINHLENWIIETLEIFEIKGERKTDRVGIWVTEKPNKDQYRCQESKIASIGVRIRRWITYHGLALNVSPDLDHFSGIVPCGIREKNIGITSLVKLGLSISMSEVDEALKKTFKANIERHR